jgi:hypothetical protein
MSQQSLVPIVPAGTDDIFVLGEVDPENGTAV